ncbi:histone-lysine N-methyltransferase 2D [Osmerus eperlanus]|uniref:histone-lysine N-methyltransferase 2D n=1 Tax=Osmerus eperlanus TaxID=29151 RepID=UPI002E10F64F
MDMSAEWARAPAQVDDKSVSMNETEWEQTSQLQNNEHVNVLLDISEDICYKEQEPFESLSLNGWEDAVQGWGLSPPLSCLFQPPRRGKTTRTTDPADYHCLLCADLKLWEPPGPDDRPHSPTSSSGAPPREDPQLSKPSRSALSHSHVYVPYNRHSALRWSQSAVPCGPSLSCRPPAPPSDPSAVCGRSPLSSSPSPLVIHPSSDTEAPVSPRMQSLNKASQQPSVRDKLSSSSEVVVEEDRGGDPSERLSPRPPPAGPPSRPPPQEVSDCPQPEDRGGNMKLIINSFSVLPPVRASSQTRLPGAPRLPRRAEPPSGHSEGALWEEESSHAVAGESGGVEREEETRVGRVPEENGHPAVTSAYLASRQSHSLLSAFSIQVHQRAEAPLLGLADPPARAPCPLGGHLRQDPRTTSGHRLVFGTKPKNVKRVQPQLPTLMGTRVRIPASSHRLL